MKLNLAKVQHKCLVNGCPNAENGVPIDRHHRRSQKLFVRAFRRKRSTHYRSFCDTYKEFREQDISRVCREHHDYVHKFVYYPIIEAEKRRLRKTLRFFTWEEAEGLMNKLEEGFNEWLKDAPSIPLETIREKLAKRSMKS